MTDGLTDAMRWVPEREQASADAVPYLARWQYPRFFGGRPDTSEVAANINRTVTPLFEAVRRACSAFGEAVQKTHTRLLVHKIAHETGNLPTPLARCRICRPKANPPASPVTAAYRRRQLARKRRRRRR